MENTGYPLKRLYQKLGEFKAAEARYSYLKPKVEDAARRQNRAQDPVLLGTGRGRALVRF